MKVKRLVSFILLLTVLTLVPTDSLATKWAHSFVVWDGYVYVITDDSVEDVDKKIGEVTKYSSYENYSGNFSNTYKKGTNYYSIKGVSTEEAIAVKDGIRKYKKAVRDGKYTGVQKEDERHWSISFLFVAFIVGSVFTIVKINKSSI